jgi:hypothetical protein
MISISNYWEVFTTDKQKIEIILSVDTHLDKHFAVLIDERGKYLEELSVDTTVLGYQTF